MSGFQTGALANVLFRRYGATYYDGSYSSRRNSALTLPYYDFYFASLWNRYDYHEGGFVGPKVLQSSASGSVSGGNDVGGLIGLLSGGLVQGSYSTASVSGSKTVGGLVGRTGDSGTIRDSFATGSVTGNNWAVGGLAGYLGGKGAVFNSFATGEVSLGNGSARLGALVGSGDRYRLEDSYGLGYQIPYGGGVATIKRVYGRGDGVERWTCSDAPFRWSSADLGADDDTCASYTTGGGQEADYGWDFGTSSEYPVPSYNVLTPAEIRALIPSP